MADCDADCGVTTELVALSSRSFDEDCDDAETTGLSDRLSFKLGVKPSVAAEGVGIDRGSVFGSTDESVLDSDGAGVERSRSRGTGERFARGVNQTEIAVFCGVTESAV